jgi:RNA polymerase sigma-70 factor, ECF subfamily
MPWELPISAASLNALNRDLLNQTACVRALADREPNMSEAAFGAFYAETARPLFGYLLRISGDRALEAYCRLLSADLPRMSQSESRSYLFRIATNLLHDRWRQHKEVAMPDSVFEIAAASPELDSKLELRRAFLRLKPRERELLWLAYVEGSNHSEIAECTGLRSGSIRMLLFRARKKLLSLLSGNGPDASGEGFK